VRTTCTQRKGYAIMRARRGGNRTRVEIAGCVRGTMKSSLMAVLAISLTACSPAPNSARWPEGPPIDLSHDYSDQTVFWPRPRIQAGQGRGWRDRAGYYAANNFSTSEHGGTHIDAPVHFARVIRRWIRFRSIDSSAPPSSSTSRRRAPINPTIG